jgi:hypothetical protein
MDRQARTGAIVLVKSREMIGVGPKHCVVGGGRRGKDDKEQMQGRISYVASVWQMIWFGLADFMYISQLASWVREGKRSLQRLPSAIPACRRNKKSLFPIHNV